MNTTRLTGRSILISCLLLAALAARAEDATERRVLLHEVAALRTDLQIAPLPKDPSAISTSSLRAEFEALSDLKKERDIARQKAAATQIAQVKAAESAMKKTAPSAADAIAKLKASFPPKSSGSIYIQPRGKNRQENKITFDVPTQDQWSWYKGMFQTTTLQALPRTLEMVDKRFDEDMAKLNQAGGGESARVQAEQTGHWFVQTLRPYIEQWRTLVPRDR